MLTAVTVCSAGLLCLTAAIWHSSQSWPLSQPWVWRTVTAFRVLGDYISAAGPGSEAACRGQHFPSLTEVTFGMSEERTQSHAAAMSNKRRQPHGFMQNNLNIPAEENGLTDLSSRMMRRNILYASFGNVKILEQRLPCGTS